MILGVNRNIYEFFRVGFKNLSGCAISGSTRIVLVLVLISPTFTQATFAADKIQVQTQFDTRGQVLRKSLPHKFGDTVRWTEFRYDSLDRQIRLTHPDGATVTTNYLPGHQFGAVETVDESANKQASHFDAFGNEIYRDRYDQALRLRTRYQYDVLDRLIDIRDPKGSLYWYAYDGHGNRIFDADPNLGCREMVYDAGNRLKEQRSASGALVSYSYDVLSRVTSKTADKDALQFSNCSFPIISGTRTETGGGGNDTLDAGDGRLSDVTLSGGSGDDIYIIRARSGHVVIPSSAEGANGGSDTIRFVDLVLANLTITEVADPQGGEFLQFSWREYGTVGSLKVAHLATHVERFEFADGVTLKRIHVDGVGRVVMTGTDGNDYIRGGVIGPGDGSGRFHDDNGLFAGAGNDTLETGASDYLDWQYLEGQAGDDTYLIGSDGGSVIIDSTAEAAGGTDTVRFKDLSLSDMTVTYQTHGNANGEALKFAWTGEGNRPAGQFHIADKGNAIERFEFADGVTLKRIHVDGVGRVVMTGTDGDDYIRGGVIGPGDGSGRYHDDNGLFAGVGNDTLETGASDYLDWQYLEGQAGDDTYLIGSEGGSIIIDSTAEAAGGTDTVRFKDLSLSDMTITYQTHGNANGEALKFAWIGEGNRPAGQFHIADKGNAIERFEFADGVTLKRIHVDGVGRVVMTGTDGDDYIRGGVIGPGDGTGRFHDDNGLFAGAGNDTLETGASDYLDWQYLEGQAGDDTYLIGSDGGSVIIDSTAEAAGGTDTVRFKDLSLSDMTVTYQTHGNANGEALKFAWTGEGNRPAGQFHIADKGNAIERFEFADGVTLKRIHVDGVGRVVMTGTDGNDYIRGGVIGPGDGSGRYHDDNGLFAGAGNDTLETGASDYLDWQYLEGQAGDDTYLIGSEGGSIIIDSTAEVAGGTDTVRFKDLLLSDLTVSYQMHANANGNALKFTWLEDGSRPKGQFHIANEAQHIERFEFADGSVRTTAELLP